MTRTILVAGTASHVGKSTVVSGLCRLLVDHRVSVAPYKAQNMSNNARVVPRVGERGNDATGSDHGEATEVDGRGRPNDVWGEIGVSQFVQARAARITPTTDLNPVLLKPRGDGESQLVLQGRPDSHVAAGAYYEEHWNRARDAAVASYRRLAAEYDVIVAEGAGSIAEINLHHRDLANVEAARFADAEIVLLVDIERGGAFASLYGTLELMPDDLRDRVVGAIITKFRGDESLLESGIRNLEGRTGIPILGVIPYDDPGLPAEDSVGLPAPDEHTVRGGGDGIPDTQAVTIAVPRFPRLSNATDLEALLAEPGVRVEYVPVPTASGADHSERRSDGAEEVQYVLDRADAVVLPGTKNTVDDLRGLYAAGFDRALESFTGPVIGICGGYQMLGERLVNVGLEAAGSLDSQASPSRPSQRREREEVLSGLGRLPVETTFEPSKRLEQCEVEVDGDASPLLTGASGTASGYEIHTGRTRVLEPDVVSHPLGPGSAASGTVLGTYLHGLFDNENVRRAILESIRSEADVSRPPNDRGSATERNASSVSSYDHAATLVERNVDLGALGFDR